MAISYGKSTPTPSTALPNERKQFNTWRLQHVMRLRLCKAAGQERARLPTMSELPEAARADIVRGGWPAGSKPTNKFAYARLSRAQISFQPGFGAYQGLAQKIKVPFSRIFCSFEGSRAISKPAPNPGTHQTPVETLSE